MVQTVAWSGAVEYPDMAKTTLDVIKDSLAAANRRLDALAADRPAQPSPGTAQPTGMDTSRVWRSRLTAGRPAFHGDPSAPDANRRVLASVDLALVAGVQVSEPADADAIRTAIALDGQKLDTFHAARLHRDQRRAELADAADASPAVSHAVMERLSAAVRTAEQGVTKAEQVAKGITPDTLRTRTASLDSRVDAHREDLASAVLRDLERALPAAVVTTVMADAAERDRSNGR